MHVHDPHVVMMKQSSAERRGTSAAMLAWLGSAHLGSQRLMASLVTLLVRLPSQSMQHAAPQLAYHRLHALRSTNCTSCAWCETRNQGRRLHKHRCKFKQKPQRACQLLPDRLRMAIHCCLGLALLHHSTSCRRLGGRWYIFIRLRHVGCRSYPQSHLPTLNASSDPGFGISIPKFPWRST